MLGQTQTAATTQALVLGYPFTETVYKSDAEYSELTVRPYKSMGSWTSPVYDLGGRPSTQGRITWQQDLPVGTSIEIRTSTSQDLSTWSPWSPAYADPDGSNISSPNARYLRVSATLRADETLEFSPVLDGITVTYPDADPSVPILSSTSHPRDLWANPQNLALQWQMPAGNPAPEAGSQYVLRVGGQLTLTAAVALTLPAGSVHSASFALPQEGLYTADLVVTGDAFSGARTRSAQTYAFGYDASAPGQTDVVSATHPPLLFTNNRNPVFQLSAIDAVSGVSGYAAVLDKAPTGDPGTTVNAGEQLRFANIDNGTWYLHARAIDMAGNAGPVTHYGIRVDFNGELLSPDYVKALPNPVRTDQAKLEYELAAPATDVTLEFLNGQGELLKTADGGRTVGKNYYYWDLGSLANGVYLFRVKARSAEDGRWTTVVRKVAVIR